MNKVGKNNKKRLRSLPEDKMMKFKKIYHETRVYSRFDNNENFIQHGSTTVKSHCINVAHTAYYMTYKLHINVNEDELIRGALLHDYFQYDWHEKSLKNSIHGYTHGRTALLEAKKDFDLSATERDMIKHHMFPLTPRAPRSREGAVLCIADKLCAIKETLEGKDKK